MPNAIKSTNGNGQSLTLRDRLSRLSYTQACKLLEPHGEKLLRAGGGYEINLEKDVRWTEYSFTLQLNGTLVSITSDPGARMHLAWDCTQCGTLCEHIGAAISTVLEEKTALGLAMPPPERVPIESLSEEELVRQAIQERQERSRAEKMIIRPVDAKSLWSDYVVSSAISGKSYRVALRGWAPGESYCSCPDFRKNTLGVCKHVFKVHRHATARFSPRERNRPFRPTELGVYLRYGAQLELRLLAPERVDPAATSIIRPIADGAIDDVHDLLRRMKKLAAIGVEATVYPDAEEFIQQRLFQDRIAAKVAELRLDLRRHPLRRELLKFELLPYQLDGIAFAVGVGRAILADDMGLGKTIQAVGVAELLAKEAAISRVLIVCPASLKAQWRGEIQRFSNRDCRIVVGGAAERARHYENGCFFTICNYEQVLRDILTIEKVPWDLIVLDEGQRIKNWEAKITRVMKGLKSPFALVLTGTPLENRLDDLYSIMEFIDDRRLGPAFRFFNRHRVVDESGKVLGYKNLDELRTRLKPVLLRRTRGTVMQELPPRTNEIVRITPTDEQMGLHDANRQIISQIVRKKFFTEMDLLRLRKALLMCRMAADSTFLVDKQKPGYSSKLETLNDLLGPIFDEKGRKAVLFSEWTTMLDLIEPLITKRGLGFVRLDGSVPQIKRQPLVQAFREQPDCRLFLTTNAGSTGLNLQAADTVINVDLPWNPAILEQRIARAHRMGQKKPVQVYILITESTIEESLLATLSAKQNLALAALDPESSVDAVDMASGTEDLKRRLEVLLGAVPPAPSDVSEHKRITQEAEALSRKEKVSEAGGALFAAAMSFMRELLPAAESSPELLSTASLMKTRLSQCAEIDAQGRMKLTLTLPDASALDGLATTLASLLAARS